MKKTFRKTSNGWEYFTREDLVQDPELLNDLWNDLIDGNFIFYDIENGKYYTGDKPESVTGPCARYPMPLSDINDFFIFCKEQIDDEAIEDYAELYAHNLFFIDLFENCVEEYYIWNLEQIRDYLPTLDDAFGNFSDEVGLTKAQELMDWYYGDELSILYDNWNYDSQWGIALSVTNFPEFKLD